MSLIVGCENARATYQQRLYDGQMSPVAREV
jgi:hypothetical protein